MKLSYDMGMAPLVITQLVTLKDNKKPVSIPHRHAQKKKKAVDLIKLRPPSGHLLSNHAEKKLL